MSTPSPSELRNTLGANLRELVKSTESVSALCRDLGINRTQFNRYLSGESFPRPDVLFRICQYFNVDARIILEPLSDMDSGARSLLNHPEISEFLSGGVGELTESLFPSGFYQFARRSFLDETQFIQGLVYVYRKDDATFLRGFEAKQAIIQQGLPPNAKTREFRGILLAQEGGIAGLVSRRGALTTSFNFLAQVPSFQNNYWVGYTVRTVRESLTGSRVARLVYEYLGSNGPKVREAARKSGFCSVDDLVPYQRTQLRVDEPFH
ncbi:helix-turn-helix domain-containing protein [Marivita geojedonensis]|uniref:XRE family transcriptional regulator n=1 Tax=Marivita geojedonensis TaxID=1123756 RepID=A0A1X4NNL5_9RHOB|nr:helix-turn-helix transcriptional regulator [Marivita geojedonensis]OSQ52110.1 XRE family transcriptional regulator [Marivita geojedonensis]PRY81114.1 Cro/C1-type helix-turn-helix DNA-binding protein [Marivita geojedonensis]